MADTKRPPLLIPKPVELAGMRARLLRAQGQQKDLAQIGRDYDTVMDGIDEAKQVLKGHVGDLRIYEASVRSTIEGMIERSNGAPSDGESDGRQSSSSDHGEDGGEDVGTKPDAQAAPDGTDANPPAPEQLTVNGVTRQP